MPISSTGNHVPHGITQCYLMSLGRNHIPPVHQPIKQVIDSATPEGCKAEMDINRILSYPIIRSDGVRHRKDKTRLHENAYNFNIGK